MIDKDLSCKNPSLIANALGNALPLFVGNTAAMICSVFIFSGLSSGKSEGVWLHSSVVMNLSAKALLVLAMIIPLV
jgi:hypothetical protein